MKTIVSLIIAVYSGFLFANPVMDGESLYQLKLDLTDQTGEHAGLDVFRGQPVLISMIYASCPHVCPLTISTLQLAESELTQDQRSRLRVLLVSFDPENDTVEKLAELARRHKVDGLRWKLARADAGDVRKLAAVLGVRFRKLPDGSFNHSTVITLLNAGGVPVLNSNMLARADPALLSAIRELLSPQENE